MALFGLGTSLGVGGGPVAAPSVRDYLFIATGNQDTDTKGKVWRMEIVGETLLIDRTLVFENPTATEKIVAVAVDITNHRVYFNIEGPSFPDFMYSADLDGANRIDITPADHYIDTPTKNGIAILDGQYMYITEAFNESGERYDLDGTNKLVIATIGDEPHMPVLNPDNPAGGEVAWHSLVSSYRKIWVFKYDGTVVENTGEKFTFGGTYLFDDTHYWGQSDQVTMMRVLRSDLSDLATAGALSSGDLYRQMIWYSNRTVNNNIYALSGTPFGYTIDFIDKDFAHLDSWSQFTLDGGVTYPPDMLNIAIGRFVG